MHLLIYYQVYGQLVYYNIRADNIVTYWNCVDHSVTESIIHYQLTFDSKAASKSYGIGRFSNHKLKLSVAIHKEISAGVFIICYDDKTCYDEVIMLKPHHWPFIV